MATAGGRKKRNSGFSSPFAIRRSKMGWHRF
jgi:hypothetical protein